MGDMNRTLRDAFDRWKDALIDQDKQTTQAARHRAHARVTSMEDLIAETPADDIEGIGIKLAIVRLYERRRSREGRQCAAAASVGFGRRRPRAFNSCHSEIG
jgi:hypothetical protein